MTSSTPAFTRIPLQRCVGLSWLSLCQSLSVHGHDHDRDHVHGRHHPGGRPYSLPDDHPYTRRGGHPGGHDTAPCNAEHTRGCTSRLAQSRPAHR
ncbi:MAG: hypothetical protein ACXWTU_03600, partial [Methylotenera sp.]